MQHKNTSKLTTELPAKITTFTESVDRLDTDKFRAVTTAPNEPALYFSEQEKLVSGKGAIQRLKGTASLAASALLAGSLLLSACGDEGDDCIVTTPPTNSAANVVLPPIVGATPSSGSGATNFTGSPQATPAPTQPGSSQFTSGQSTSANQTYCRSRRSGGFYWYSGTRYYGSSGS
jgi:hypothetical protein